jgi:dTDP-4-amino-4,6-dideoxygalactose transaminase
MVQGRQVLEKETMIDFFGIKRQYANLRDEILDATDSVYQSGQVLDGEYTARFEASIALRCNRRHAISVNSGTTGLMFALQAREPGRVKRRGILIPAVSFVATLNATQMIDEYTEICDVDFAGLIDLTTPTEPLRDKIDTIMYVNLFGNTVDYDKFRVQTEFFSEGMYIIEDAAQSFGASYKGIPSGKMGTVSVLSFDPTKNLNNYGSGGMILTDDEYLAAIFKNFRDNGKSSGHEIAGINSKMSEADCAQMMVKLKYFDKWQQRRAEIANFYIDTFGSYVDILPTTEGTTHAWSKFAFRLSNRSNLRGQLQSFGIPTKIHYERALYDEVLGRHLLDPILGTQWEAYRFTHECMSLPIYPELTDAEVEHIALSVKNHFTL